MDVLIRTLAVRDGDEMFDGLRPVEVDLAVDAGCLFQRGTKRVDVSTADAAGFVNFSVRSGIVRSVCHCAYPCNSGVRVVGQIFTVQPLL